MHLHQRLGNTRELGAGPYIRKILMRRLIIVIGLLLVMMTGGAEPSDTLVVQVPDTVTVHEQPKKKMGLIRRIIRGFDRLDERYIEPQHYVFAAMLQTTYNYERYSLSGGDQSITMKPDRNLRVGPYAGWKWVFLGYTFELGNLNFGGGRREFNFSMYSSQIVSTCSIVVLVRTISCDK